MRGPRIETARSLRRRMTGPERLLWKYLRRHQTAFHFRRQHPFAGYVLDFYCHASRLCIELDGEGHEQFHAAHDKERDEILARQGILTLRVKNHELAEDLPGLMERISVLCMSRSRPPGT